MVFLQTACVVNILDLRRVKSGSHSVCDLLQSCSAGVLDLALQCAGQELPFSSVCELPIAFSVKPNQS